MSLIIAAAQIKGGAGKSTLCQNLAGSLHHSGHRVAILDGDHLTGASLRWAAARSADQDGCDVVRAFDGERITSARLRELAAPYEVALVDTPPEDAETLRAAINAAHVCVIPVPLARQDFDQVVETVALIRSAQNSPRCCFVLRGNSRLNVNRHVAKRLGQLRTPFPVFGLPELVSFQEATWFGQSVLEYAPRSAAAREFHTLASNVVNLVNSTQTWAPPTLVEATPMQEVAHV